MFNMNDIYARLANGEKIEDIGNEIAAMMNEAMAKHQAEQEAARVAAAEADKAQAKRELIEELVEIVQELAILEGMDPDELQVTEEDMDQMVAAFTEMFGAMRELKKAIADMEAHMPAAAPAKVTVKASKIAPTDEQILADFIKMFN
jgi:hypothetical protein